METMDTQSLAIAAVVILALVAIAVWLWNQKQQSRRLEQRFGPEYKRAVDQFGSRPKAEAELKTREKRVEKLDIVPLAPAE